jgi:hypothetical protein
VHDVACFGKICGHGPAHIAKADERDVSHYYLPSPPVYFPNSARAMITRMISLMPSRTSGRLQCRIAAYGIVGMTKLAPSFAPPGQRQVTVLVLV